jgi:sigma-B regulation protein RsbU (phosphoserine phosphatase)
MSTGSSQDPSDRFALLYQLSQAFNSSLDLDQVLERVIDEVIAAIKAERGFVALRDDNGELIFRTARGIEKTVIDDPKFQISRGVIEEVAQQGVAVLTSDAQHDNRFSGRHSVLDLRLRSIICTPLKLKDKMLGVIYVDNRLFAGLFTNDDLELLSAIASSAAIAIENARLYEIAVEKGRMERELQMAYRVQSSLIPDQVPQIPGWEFAASWQPAREVSGDYYDFISLGCGKLGLVIADVTGKGMPAALFMALTRSIVRASLDQVYSPVEGISKANRLICTDSTSSMPVTLFFGQLDTNTGELTYVNAGHNPPLHYRANPDEFTALTRTGMFLGFDDQVVYQQMTVRLHPGDFIICYTDGVPDAINAKKETFGIDRFNAILKEHRNTPVNEILAAIEKAIQSFITPTTPYDDVTLLIAKRL